LVDSWLPALDCLSLFVKIAFSLALMDGLFFVGVYIVFHVRPPIMKLYFPTFTTPLDDEHAPKYKQKSGFLSLEVWSYSLLSAIVLALELVRIAIMVGVDMYLIEA